MKKPIARLSSTDLNVLNYLIDGNTLTVNECQRIFGTTECRKIISKIRATGVEIADIKEKYVDGVGRTHNYKRYFIESRV